MIPLYFWLTLLFGAFIGATIATLIMGRVIGMRCAESRHALVMLIAALRSEVGHWDALEYAIGVLGGY